MPEMIVNVPPAQVTVAAPIINVPETVVRVNVPETVVNVAAPEVRNIVRTVERDSDGKISKIIES